jgi:hypothetical protein
MNPLLGREAVRPAERTRVDLSSPRTAVPPAEPTGADGAAEVGPVASLALIALVSVTLLLVLIGTLANLEGLRGFAVTVFLLGEVGIAPWLLVRRRPPLWFAVLALSTGVAITMAIGFVMAVTRAWFPASSFVILAVVTAGLLAYVASRDLPLALRSGGAVRPSRRRLVRQPTVWVSSLAVLGVVVAAGAALAGRTTPAPGGLFASVGAVWYVGLALIVAAGVAAQRARVTLAVPVLALSVVVVMSQAIAYGGPTVMSAARHLGFVDFIRVYGGVRPDLDIYQAWSGFFAGIAWVSDVGGIADPFVLATWWPVFIAPATTLAVAAMASHWVSSSVRMWLAAAVFSLTGTALNITYFSPQSLGLFLAVTIFAVSVRGRRPVVEPLGVGALLLVLFFASVMAVSHQISPYLTVAALGVLVLFRLVRPWWMPLLVLGPAVGWAVLNRGVLGDFVLLGAVGNLWHNARPPTHSFTQFAQPGVTRWAFFIPALMLLVVGLVALVRVLLVRDRASWALFFATLSAASLVVFTDYGQEGIFRVTLFAAPWLAVLAAGLPWARPRWTTPLLAVALVTMLAVNVYGQTALDWNRVIRPDTAAATRLYETTARKGSLLLLTGTGNATPLAQTARYVDVGYVSREALGGYPVSGDAPDDVPYDAAADVRKMTRDLVRQWPAEDYYALVSDSIGAYGERYGFQHYDDYLKLGAAMRASDLWEPVFSGPTTILYRLTDAGARLG